MPKILSRRRTFLVVSLILFCFVVFTRCIRERPRESKLLVNPSGQHYAGDRACRSCHRAICDSFVYTAHYLTSRPVDIKYIKGSFVPGENQYLFDIHRKVVMERKGKGLFQTDYLDGQSVESERFDIVMGSGRNGQTYIYKRRGELYQLPISYYTNDHDWANSPGYTGHQPFFDRPIEVRCMQCHTTFARQVSEYGFDPILYGVGCERCHGAAEKHVEYQTLHPQDKQGKFIVNPDRLARQQNLDVCALCHSGVMRGTTPAWHYQPGDTLANYFQNNSAHIDSVNLDVHANQYGLLTASKCFRVSGTMVCTTCHNTHVRGNGDLAVYGQKCMSCHSPANHNYCTMQPPAGFAMEANCVNCHMPVRASKKLGFIEEGHSAASPEMVRSHRIAIYRDVTDLLLKKSR